MMHLLCFSLAPSFLFPHTLPPFLKRKNHNNAPDFWFSSKHSLHNGTSFHVLYTPKRSLPDYTTQTRTSTTVTSSSASSSVANGRKNNHTQKKRVVVIGAGWGGLSIAHALSSSSSSSSFDVTVLEASPAVGGLVRDGFTTMSGQRPAEAGQHGFWHNYHNIYHLLRSHPSVFGASSGSRDADNGSPDDNALASILSDLAPQGQYSPRGLEAVWPVFRDADPKLPTGIAQAFYTRFTRLSIQDRLSAAPLLAALVDFDDSPTAWEKYDAVSFRDLCVRLGVSKKLYTEAFEPMILTGLFAPGAQCSAAAALGMAYFFVLKSQQSFDVQWCKGNIADCIFKPWVRHMQQNHVTFKTNTRVVGFNVDHNTKRIHKLKYQTTHPTTGVVETSTLEADLVVFAVGAEALNAVVRSSPDLSRYPEFRNFAHLRGTSCLATRLFFDTPLSIPYEANACWGFDQGVGMTLFDIRTLHGPNAPTVRGAPGAVIEVDYYHAASLLVMDDPAIVEKVRRDIETILGEPARKAKVIDAAIVRLPKAVNWYYPGSYQYMPDVKSNALDNVYFVGDIVRTRHGSWSQEKAYVTGLEAANFIMGKPTSHSILPLQKDEPHIKFARDLVARAKYVLGGGNPSRAPSLVDFMF